MLTAHGRFPFYFHQLAEEEDEDRSGLAPSQDASNAKVHLLPVLLLLLSISLSAECVCTRRLLVAIWMATCIVRKCCTGFLYYPQVPHNVNIVVEKREQTETIPSLGKRQSIAGNNKCEAGQFGVRQPASKHAFNIIPNSCLSTTLIASRAHSPQTSLSFVVQLFLWSAMLE